MIYVSYFGNRDLRSIPDEYKVCIALRNPTTTIPSCKLGLIPPAELIYGYKYGSITEEEYIEKYLDNNLYKINPMDIKKAYDGKILLCYCSGFCHRNVVEGWLSYNGVECKEFNSDEDLDIILGKQKNDGM